MHSSIAGFETTEGSFDWDLEKEELSCTGNIYNFMDKAGANISHEKLWNNLHPEDIKTWNSAFKESLSKNILNCEMRIIHDNILHWIRVYGKTICDENKKPLRIYGVAIDVTEQKTVFEDLKVSEEKFRILADAMPQQIWTCKNNGIFTFFNRAFHKYIGSINNELRLDDWFNAMHPDDRDETSLMFMNCIKKGERFIYQHRLKNFNNEYRWHLTRAIPQTDSEGNIHMWVGTSTDINVQRNFVTELEKKIRKRTSALLEENNNLVKSNLELKQFAFVASHDLQEPLRKIIVFTNRIQQKFKNEMPDGSKEYLDKIIASSQRMTKLIQDLLNFSRVSGSDKLFAPVELDQIMIEVLNDYELTIKQKKAKIKVSKLPLINANPTQITQLFHNLIGNALKFSSEDRRLKIDINVSTLSSEELSIFNVSISKAPYYKITIKDNGIGFNQEDSEKIFTLFYRLENHDINGTGIGLALCKKIAENHQGSIMAKSIPGEGSEFIIYIPSGLK